MNAWWKPYYFDAQDHELLAMVNRTVSTRSSEPLQQELFDACLHPHGIKGLAIRHSMRVAQAVVRLLDSLEDGKSEDRLVALRALYDEALNSAQSGLRRNTARVLIQIMKELVRNAGNEEVQLRLAHDFRRAASGAPRVVRHMLDRYHLVEMPEAWNQLSFDHHVHDANTKGRKNPTHLIMDAWIKGIRYLTVVYYNYVSPEAAREVLQAAAIMGISVRIGLEFAVPFRDKFVHLIWAPRGFADAQGFLDFLAEPGMQELTRQGKEACVWQQRYVFDVLHKWNTVHRLALAKECGLALPEVDEEGFVRFVGTGHPSTLHLSEYINEGLQNTFAATSPEEHERLRSIALVRRLESGFIHERWLLPEQNPELSSPDVPENMESAPALLKLTPHALVSRLVTQTSGYRISLNLADLTAEDVLELLWQCQGFITHLELFNLKEWQEGALVHLDEICALQQAINRASAPRLKKMLRDMIRRQVEMGECQAGDEIDRCTLLRHILCNIPTLQGYYRNVPLRSRLGTDSTSRAHRRLGMGIVLQETLSPRGQKYFQRLRVSGKAAYAGIPIRIQADKLVRYKENPHPRLGESLTYLIRKLPGCANFDMIREQEWEAHSATACYTANSNLAPLGGCVTVVSESSAFDDAQPRTTQPQPQTAPSLCYLNTKLANTLKVLIGFVPAVLAFLYTQSWWFLAWFGPALWFGITGFRNILQSVVGGRGLNHASLLHWKSQINWTRLCDSLMFTGFSVPLLELGVRTLLLEKSMGYTVSNYPVLVYSLMAAVNGLYLSAHNLYRGLPKEAVVGNLFRSALSIPVAMFFNSLALHLLAAGGAADPMAILQAGAAILSKTASDTVAALIEGFADRQNNVRMRIWDCQSKLRRLFETYARLEIIFPEEDALALLQHPVTILRAESAEQQRVGTKLIINALDFMYFWYYQPRAQDVLIQLVREMSEEEQTIFTRSQLVLKETRYISQLFVDGLVGNNFAPGLAFYLERHETYVRTIQECCATGKGEPPFVALAPSKSV